MKTKCDVKYCVLVCDCIGATLSSHSHRKYQEISGILEAIQITVISIIIYKI